MADLERICHCGHPIGDHTMRTYIEHSQQATLDAPYEEIPGGPDQQDVELVTVDHIVARSAVVDTPAGPLPVLLFNFATGNDQLPPIGFVGTPLTLRKVGKLLRDTANGAANAAEKASGGHHGRDH